MGHVGRIRRSGEIPNKLAITPLNRFGRDLGHFLMARRFFLPIDRTSHQDRLPGNHSCTLRPDFRRCAVDSYGNGPTDQVSHRTNDMFHNLS